MVRFRYSTDIDADGFADYTPEPPEQGRCDRCSRFLERYATMPICKTCMERARVTLMADIEKGIQKAQALKAGIAELAGEIKEARKA